MASPTASHTNTGRSRQDNIFGAGGEGQCRLLFNLPVVYAGLEVEVKLSKGLPM